MKGWILAAIFVILLVAGAAYEVVRFLASWKLANF